MFLWVCLCNFTRHTEWANWNAATKILLASWFDIFPLKYPGLYHILHNKSWTEAALLGRCSWKKTKHHSVLVCQWWGWQRAQGTGAKGVPGPPPGSSSKALQEELAARCSTSLFSNCPSLFRTVIQQLPSPIFIQLSFPACNMRIKTAPLFTVCLQAPGAL